MDFGKQYERNIYGKGLCDLPIETSRLCNKSEEVYVRSCTGNRVLRVDCEFPNYDFAITGGKDREDKGSMPEVIQGSKGNTSGFDKTNRNTFFNHSSSAPSTSTVSLLTATITVLPHFGKADSHGKKRVVMVGQQSRTLQWPIGYTATGIGPYSDRCIQKRPGDCMSRDQNGGSVVQEGTGSTYQSAETFSHKVCHFDICQNVKNVSHTHSGRQHDSLELFAENGREKNPELMQISKEIWEFLLGQEITITAEYLPENLNYKADWESRHQKDSSEWKLCPLVFSKIWKILGKKPEIDLFASRLSNQLPSYYSWKPDPSSLGRDALQQKRYHKSLYAFPPFALIHKVLKKVEEEKVPSLIIVTPTWQTQSWYPERLRLSVSNPIILPLKEDLQKGP